MIENIQLQNIKGIKQFSHSFSKTGNLVYAKNGIGKSSISSALYLMSQLQLEESLNKDDLFTKHHTLLKKLLPINNEWGVSEITVKLNDISLNVQFDNQRIIYISIKNDAPKLHIFCEDFLNTINPKFSKSRGLDEKVILNITNEDNELSDKEKNLEDNKSSLKILLGKDADGKVDDTLGFSKDLQDIFISVNANPQNYWNKIKKYIYEGETAELSEEKPVAILSKLNELENISSEDITIEVTDNIILTDLSTLPDIIKKGYSQIDSVLQKLGLDWVQDTKGHLNSTNICPACETSLDDNVRQQAITRLDNLIGSEISTATKKLQEFKCKVEGIDSSRISNFIKSNILNTKEQQNLLRVTTPFEEEESMNSCVEAIGEAKKAVLGHIDSKLNTHMGTVITDIDGLNTDIKYLEGKIKNFNDSIVKEYNDYVTKLKGKADNIRITKGTLNKDLLSAKLREKILEYQQNGFYTRIDDLNENITTLNTSILELKTETQHQKDFLSSCKDIYNGLLSQLGCKRFQINDSGKLVLNDIEIDEKHTDILSTGERNIIALTHYWIMALEKVKNEEQAKNLIFVMDDPVSSLDYNNLYNIASALEYYKKQYLSQYINSNIAKGFKKTINGQVVHPNQNALILTHDATFYTIVAQNVFKKHADYWMLLKKDDELKCEKTEFRKQSTLKMHLTDINNFIIQENKENIHTIGNSIRNVMEIAQDIECHTGDLNVYLLDRTAQESILSKVANSLSHGKFADEPIFEDTIELKKLCEEVKKYFEDNHKVEFSALNKN